MFRLLLTLLLGFLPFGAGAYDVLIEGHEPVGTKDGYPLYEVTEKYLDISTESEDIFFNTEYIDGIELLYVNGSIVLRTAGLNTAGYLDGKIHEIRLEDTVHHTESIGYFIMSPRVKSEGIVYGRIKDSAVVIGYEGGLIEANIKLSVNIDGQELPVRKIGNSAFANCATLKNVSIPTSIESINSNAFHSCKSLSFIDIPENIKQMGIYVFCRCDALEKVVIPKSINFISEGMFSNCKSLISVELPETIDKIDPKAFEGCSSLTIFNIPKYVRRIGDGAFSCSSISSVEFPESLDYIGYGAFSHCNYLESVTLPVSLEELHSGTFNGCINLKTVVFDSKLRKVNGNAFEDVKLLKIYWLSETPPEGAEKIKAENIYIPNNSYIPSSPISNKYVYVLMKSVFKEDGVVYVQKDDNTCVVADCLYDPEFTQILIPGQISNGDDLLVVEDIRDYAFYGNGYITSVSLSNTGNIGSYAFAGCGNLASAVIGSSGEIGKYAFSGNVKLADVTFGEGLKRIRTSAFEGCSSIREVRIPESVGLISSSAFKDCTGLSAVKLGSGIMEISHDTFAGCSSLESIKIPDDVTVIRKQAFFGCSSLSEVIAGKGLKNIGEDAFAGCTGMEKYYSYSVVPPVCAANALEDIDKTKCTLYVPKESMESYKEADQWKEFLLVSTLPDVNVAEIDGSEAVGVSRTEEGCVLRNVENESVVVYTLDGGLMFKTDRYEGEVIWLEPGVYVLKAGSNAVKIRL